MNQTLLVIERIVLESLELRERNIDDLVEQTGLVKPLLKSILFHLIERGIILYKDSCYQLNLTTKKEWLPIVKNEYGIKTEIKELFSSLVNQSFKDLSKSSLKMKKIWLGPSEHHALQQKLKDIDYFLENIQEKRKTKPVKEKTCEQKVIFYGSCEYEKLLQDMIKIG